jgi:hypothetical protein
MLFRAVKLTMSRNAWPEPRSNASNVAAHLAIGYNAAHKVHKAMAVLRADLDRLAAEEVETERAYATAIEKITDPNLPRLATSAAALADRLGDLERRAAIGEVPSDRELGALNGELIAAGTRTSRQREHATEPVERRNQLRGKLKGYQAMANRLGICEDAEVDRRYTEARDLLWTKPCDLAAATQAVNTYQHAVTDRRGRRG